MVDLDDVISQLQLKFSESVRKSMDVMDGPHQRLMWAVRSEVYAEVLELLGEEA